MKNGGRMNSTEQVNERYLRNIPLVPETMFNLLREHLVCGDLLDPFMNCIQVAYIAGWFEREMKVFHDISLIEIIFKNPTYIAWYFRGLADRTVGKKNLVVWYGKEDYDE